MQITDIDPKFDNGERYVKESQENVAWFPDGLVELAEKHPRIWERIKRDLVRDAIRRERDEIAG